MNQIDKGLLISKGFMDVREQVDEVKLQISAMMEAAVFAGALLDDNLNLENLMATAMYIEDLASKHHYMHVHL